MTERPFTIVEREDLEPLCPHCAQELTEVYVKSRGVPFIQGTSNIYFCPHCRKTLGLSQSRMM